MPFWNRKSSTNNSRVGTGTGTGTGYYDNRNRGNVYHPYANNPSKAQRLFEILSLLIVVCLCSILGTV
jgi:hypothetical protein